MKKFSIIILTALISSFVILFCSCAGEAKVESRAVERKMPTKTLNVYNWGEYISDEDDEECGLFDVNAAFEDYFNSKLANKYGFYIKVNYSTYATNEDMYAKITNSAVAYDIVIPSDYMIQKMINHKNEKGEPDPLLIKLDYSKLTNYSNINEDFKGLYYDPENEYSVPYTYGMVGIIYNSEFIKEEEEEDIQNKSWALLWNEKYARKILQFNNPRDSFATAMFYSSVANGEPLNINSHEYSDWDKALELLKEQKPLLQGYVNDEIFNKMKGASAYIAPYYAGDFLTMAADNSDLRFYYPAEGTNYFVDAFCIPTTSKNPDVAHEYINYMIDVEAATANALYIGYASPNKAVVESKHYIEMLDYNYSVYESDEEDAKCLVDAYEILYGVGKSDAQADYPFNPAYENYYKDEATGIDIQTHVNELWESLKTESSTEPWIHITSIAIVVGVLSYATYDLYVKKKRSRDYRMRDKAKKNKA